MGKTEDALRALVCQKQKQNACACRYQAHVCHGNVAHHRRPLIGHYATWFLGKGEDPGVVFSTVMTPPCFHKDEYLVAKEHTTLEGI